MLYLFVLYVGIAIGFAVGRYPQATKQMLGSFLSHLKRGVRWVKHNPHRIPYELISLAVMSVIFCLITVHVEESHWLILILVPYTNIFWLLPKDAPGIAIWYTFATLALLIFGMQSVKTAGDGIWLGMSIRTAAEVGWYEVWALLTSEPWCWMALTVAIIVILQTATVRWFRISKLRTANA